MCVSFMYRRHFKICCIMLHGKQTLSNVVVVNRYDKYMKWFMR